MKPILATTLLLLLQLMSYSQAEIIELTEKGNSLKSIIPKGWRTLATTKGDLNKDGKEDIAFVIQNTDPSNFELNDGIGFDTIDLNPRILGIYFGEKNGGFAKKLQSNEFIILQGPTMDEPLDSLNITDKGLLEIQFLLWYSAGSWSMSHKIYQFKYQNNQFELVQYEHDEMHRGSGDGSYTKIDFQKKKMEIIKSEIDPETDEEDVIKECKKIKLEKLQTIKSLKRPFEWEFNDIYI